LSIFKTKWIILKISKIKEQEFLYTIFTKEYWKIRCNKKLSKKEKNLDLWYIVNFEITTKENISIHKIRNIKIISEFNSENKKFNELNLYLTILSIILNKTANWLPIFELYDLTEMLNKIENMDEIKLILIKLKVISIFWELNENHNNQTISKILKFINQNKIDRIIKLTWINDEIKKELELI
jgi:recombinational DNA repair protein (RecF pathway)